MRSARSAMPPKGLSDELTGLHAQGRQGLHHPRVSLLQRVHHGAQLVRLGLLWVNPSTKQVQPHSTLQTGSYTAFQGVARAPVLMTDRPDLEALRAHIRKVAIEGSSRSRLKRRR